VNLVDKNGKSVVYSDNAVRAMKKSLAEVDFDRVWEAHHTVPHNKPDDRPRCDQPAASIAETGSTLRSTQPIRSRIRLPRGTQGSAEALPDRSVGRLITDETVRWPCASRTWSDLIGGPGPVGVPSAVLTYDALEPG
jgi:hypothetical protein